MTLSSASPVRHFAALVWHHARGAAALTLGTMVLLSLTEGIGILLLVPLLVLAGVVPGPSGAGGWWSAAAAHLPRSLAAVLAIYVLTIAARALLEGLATSASAQVQARLTSGLRESLYRALVRAQWDAVVRLRGARLAHVLTVELDRVAIVVTQLLYGMLDTAVALTYVIAALALSPYLALLAAGMAVLLMIVTMTQRRSARQDGESLSSLGDELFTGAVEQLGMLKLAKSGGLGERVADGFAARASRYAAATVHTQRRWSTSRATLTIGAAAALAAVVYVAVTFLHLPAARLLLLLFVCARLVPRISSAQGSVVLAARAMPAALAVQALLDELTAAAERPHHAIGTIAPPEAWVALERVTYRYPDTASPAVRDLSFSLPVGGVTALVGPTGAGKSTVADLLLMLLPPEQGALTLDGHTIPHSAGAAWRRMIGYVPQDTLLLHDTIAANLRWVAPAASDRDLRAALTRAGADTLLARLPEGIETIVGDRGALLSGGERQRIAIARALLGDPRILILDEATSALDAESEAEIRSTIAELTPAVTVLSITHRLASARAADHVVVMDEGTVVAMGTWDDLVRAPGSRLAMQWAAQMGAVPTKDSQSSSERTALHS